MSKTVLTYSWLMRKAMALFKKDPDAYSDMTIGGGTDKMLRGVVVSAVNFWDYRPAFLLSDPLSRQPYVSIFCHYVDGKFYTNYQLRFTTTGYRKRITDKYLPITLPEGVRSRFNKKGESTPCIIHNADGSEACRTTYYGGRVRRPGDCGERLVIDDATGKWVGGEDWTQELSLSASNVNARLAFGWFEGASRNRTEWLDSIKALPEGMCDHMKMLTVAAKAYLTAARMTQKYPHIRMAMFPAAQADDGVMGRWQNRRHDSSATRRVVMARSEAGVPTLYHLPEVLLYWIEDVPKSYYNACRENAGVRLSITIPPHGNPLLDPRGKASLSSKTKRANERRWDAVEPEQPYHALMCWKGGVHLGKPRKSSLSVKFDDVKPGHHLYDQEQYLAVWPEHEDKALVMLECDELSELKDCPFPMDTPMAMKPEDIGLRFEEKFLMESLPLC